MTGLVDMLRIATGVIWLLLMIGLAKPTWRVWRAAADLRPTEAVMGAVWVLCLNRETFTLVSIYMPGDADALALCYAFAFFGGINMLFACSWARRISKRQNG